MRLKGEIIIIKRRSHRLAIQENQYTHHTYTKDRIRVTNKSR